MIFVIEYDREQGEIVQRLEFEVSRRDEAFRARLALEIDLLKKNLEREVVLLEATNLDALRSSHGRYFKSASELAEVGESRIGALELEDASKIRSKLKEQWTHSSSKTQVEKKKSK